MISEVVRRLLESEPVQKREAVQNTDPVVKTEPAPKTEAAPRTEPVNVKEEQQTDNETKLSDVIENIKIEPIGDVGHDANVPNVDENKKGGTSNSDDGAQFIKPKTEPMDTTSSDIDPEDVSNERLLSLRGAGDFKYGYEDIITGTFDEKLDECISKGLAITKKTTENDNLSVTLYQDYQNMLKMDGYKKFMQFRETLPTYKKAEDLLDVIKNNQVVVISGETGCGKSTQVRTK